MSDSLPDLEPPPDEGEATATVPASGQQAPPGQPEASTRQQPRPTGVSTDRTAAAVAPVEVLKTVADPVRYRVLQALAGGEVMSVIGLAKQLKIHPDTMGKHIKVLRRARLNRRVKQEGGDGRNKYFQSAKECRPASTDGKRWLDFGSCVLRLG